MFIMTSSFQAPLRVTIGLVCIHVQGQRHSMAIASPGPVTMHKPCVCTFPVILSTAGRRGGRNRMEYSRDPPEIRGAQCPIPRAARRLPPCAPTHTKHALSTQCTSKPARKGQEDPAARLKYLQEHKVLFNRRRKKSGAETPSIWYTQHSLSCRYV